MGFNPLENLKNGNVDFILNLSLNDRDFIISNIRNAENRNEIIDGFLSLLKDINYSFCFEVIFDLEDYKDDTKYILNKYMSYKDLSKKQIEDILFHTSWGKEYIMEHMDEIYKDEDEIKLIIFKFILQDINNHEDLIKEFYLHKDLHIRFLFMNYIVQNHPNLINIIYDDFTKYITGYSQLECEQLSFIPMNMEDVCELAISVFESSLDKKIWLKLKKYILETYKENKLANLLLSDKLIFLNENTWKSEDNELGISEFATDADRLFNSSIDYRFYILLNYPHLISQNILESYKKNIDCFKRNGEYDSLLSYIYSYQLGTKLEKYVDKYLSLSKSREVMPLEEGSTVSPYRIGDYVIKLVDSKWSYEDIICPDLFLIIKNLEENYIRDEYSNVRIGIEVQQYLSQSVKNVPRNIIDEYKKAFENLGWFVADRLVKTTDPDNCMLLNSYKDADCENPEELPDWFKEYPMVLVDRDLVFKLTNDNPKRNCKPISW